MNSNYNPNSFGATMMCNNCGLNYRIGTAHSCLITLQERMKAQEDRYLAEIKEIQEQVQLAFKQQYQIIEGLKKDILGLSKEN